MDTFIFTDNDSKCFFDLLYSFNKLKITPTKLLPSSCTALVVYDQKFSNFTTNLYNFLHTKKK